MTTVSFTPETVDRDWILVDVEESATAGTRAGCQRWDLRYAPRYGWGSLPVGWIPESSPVGLLGH